MAGDQQAQEFDKLNPGVAQVQEPQFLNYSKLNDLPNATGDLFKNLGETVKGAVQGMDTFFKERIRGEATAAVDRERDRTSEYLMGGRNPVDTPSDIKQSANFLGNLKVAKDQGQINQAYYQMRLDTVARDLRTRYPGYREHIDNVISDLTGGTPANKMITDLFHNAQSKTDPEQQLNTWLIHQMTEKVPGGGAYVADYRTKNGGSNPPNNEMLTRVSVWQSNSALVQAEKHELDLKREKSKATEEEIARVASIGVRASIANGMKQGGLFGTDLDEFKKNMGEASEFLKTNPQLTPEKQSALLQQANNIDMKIKTLTEAELNHPRYQNITPEAREKIVKEQDNLSKLIRAGLGEKGQILPGHIGLAKSILDNYETGGQLSVISSDNVLAQLYGVNKMAGPNATDQLLTYGEDRRAATPGARFNKKTILDVLDKSVRLGMASGTENIADSAKKYQDKTGEAPPPGELKGHIDAAKEGIKNSEKNGAAPEFKTNLLRSLYEKGDAFISQVAKGEQLRTYSDMAAPDMTQEAFKEREAGRPENWEMYKRFIDRTGRVLTRTEMTGMLQSGQGVLPAQGVLYDPATQSFTAEFAPGQTSFATGPANNLNRIIEPLTRSMKLDGANPEQINERVANWIANAGVDPKKIFKPEPAKEGEKKSPFDTTIQKTPTEKRSESTPQNDPLGFFRQDNKGDRQSVASKSVDKGTLEQGDINLKAVPGEDNPSVTETENLKIFSKNGKYYIIPKMGYQTGKPITPKEIDRYLASDSGRIGFDDSAMARERMFEVERQRMADPDKWRPFGYGSISK